MSRSDDYERDDRYDDRDRYDDPPRRRRRYDAPDPDSGRRKVKPPAIALIIVGVLHLGFTIWAGLGSVLFFDQQWEEGMAQRQRQARGTPQQQQAERDMMNGMKPAIHMVSIAIPAVAGLLAVVVIFGASRMLTLSSAGWGWAASVIAVLPLSCWVWPLGIGFGIWAMVVLASPDVKRAFATNRRGGRTANDDDDRE